MIETKLLHLLEEFESPRVNVLVMFLKIHDLLLELLNLVLVLECTNHAFVERRFGVLDLLHFSLIQLVQLSLYVLKLASTLEYFPFSFLEDCLCFLGFVNDLGSYLFES